MRRWMLRFLACCLLLVGMLATLTAGEAMPARPPRTGPDDSDLASFDAMMERFLQDHAVPGAALAVAKDGRLVYARGFGYSDPAAKTPVTPRAMFRIASISKPITAAAILRLVELGKLKLDESAFDVLGMSAGPGVEEDPRLRTITIRHLLQHTGGFDRQKSGDPMFEPAKVAGALKIAPPPAPGQIIRYMMGRKLDFDPGARYVYCNFGYCVLGRIVEKISGKGYEAFVRDAVLDPLQMANTRLGKTLEQADGEVKYVDLKGRTTPAVFGAQRGKPVPLPYGAWRLEDLDALGGWISSAPDLVRFASSFDARGTCPILRPNTIAAMFDRPAGAPGRDGNGRVRGVYYGCGWDVRIVDRRGALNTWHMGSFAGTATLLVRRHDGLCWAVLFNAREDERGRYLASQIAPLVDRAADRVRRWPDKNLFATSALD